MILIAPRSPKGPDPKELLRPVAATVADIMGARSVAAMKPGDILCVRPWRAACSHMNT